MFENFNLQEFLSAFIVLFAIIDIIGSVPIIINLKQRERPVSEFKATILNSLTIMSLLIKVLYLYLRKLRFSLTLVDNLKVGSSG